MGAAVNRNDREYLDHVIDGVVAETGDVRTALLDLVRRQHRFDARKVEPPVAPAT